MQRHPPRPIRLTELWNAREWALAHVDTPEFVAWVRPAPAFKRCVRAPRACLWCAYPGWCGVCGGREVGGCVVVVGLLWGCVVVVGARQGPEECRRYAVGLLLVAELLAARHRNGGD